MNPWKVLITAEPIKTVGEQAQKLLREAGCEIIFSPQFGPLKEKALISALDGMDAVIASHDNIMAKQPLLVAPFILSHSVTTLHKPLSFGESLSRQIGRFGVRSNKTQ